MNPWDRFHRELAMAALCTIVCRLAWLVGDVSAAGQIYAKAEINNFANAWPKAMKPTGFR